MSTPGGLRQKPDIQFDAIMYRHPTVKLTIGGEFGATIDGFTQSGDHIWRDLSRGWRVGNDSCPERTEH